MFLVIFVVFSLWARFSAVQCDSSEESSEESNDFENPYQWSYLNFTWPSNDIYNAYVNNGSYIPQNNVLSGIKIYQGTIYISLPRYRSGTPVTLTTVPPNSPQFNPLLEPFPNWAFNVQEDDCTTLQSVQSMEIDTKGIMWVIDGVRLNNISKECPGKLVLMDLNDGGRVVHSYDFPEDVCSRTACFLNDLVVEEHPDGDYAYIPESSTDAGLIVYSRREDKAWKLRDNRTMQHEVRAENFTLNGDVVTHNYPIDGIALTQKSAKKRYVYYSALTGFALYRIPTWVVKDYELGKNGGFREHIEHVGDKPSQGDAMAVDNEGNMFLTLITEHAIGKWDTRKSFKSEKIIERNETLMDWPDAMAFDNLGSIYVTTVKHVYKAIDPTIELEFSPDLVEYNVVKITVGTISYMYSKDD